MSTWVSPTSLRASRPHSWGPGARTGVLKECCQVFYRNCTTMCLQHVFSRELLRRVVRKNTSAELRLIYIFTSSPLHIYIFTYISAHLHMLTSAHLHVRIFTSARLHHHCTSTCSHLHICTSTSSLHIYIFSSSHLHIYISAHLHILTSAHLTSSPLALLYFLS